MSKYLAQLNPDSTVAQVIVCADPAWASQRLGGTWVPTNDPYGEEPLGEWTEGVYENQGTEEKPDWVTIVEPEFIPAPVTYCGPGYGHDDTFPEKFAPPWVAPAPDPETGVWSSYAKGALAFHDGHLWKSTVDGNVWEPGISAWHPEPDIDGVLPDWIQPTGAHDVWPIGAQVNHLSKRWESLVPANVWEPGTNATLWRDLDAPAVSEWVQPTGAHDAYQIDDVVTYNGQTWKSTAANNVWAPGVFGWIQV